MWGASEFAFWRLRQVRQSTNHVTRSRLVDAWFCPIHSIYTNSKL